MTPQQMILKLKSGRLDEIDVCGYEIANMIQELLDTIGTLNNINRNSEGLYSLEDEND